jgi:hypothetical protein
MSQQGIGKEEIINLNDFKHTQNQNNQTVCGAWLHGIEVICDTQGIKSKEGFFAKTLCHK